MNINVSINSNCELVASPDNNILEEQLNKILNPCYSDNYMYVEFVLNPDLKIEDTLCISKKKDFYTQSLPKDGLYIYYCLKTIISNTKEDNCLYYNSEKKTLYFNGKEVKDYKELASLLPAIYSDGDGLIEYIEKPMFSICQLRNCVTHLQRESIGNCTYHKCKTNSDSKMRDFLFISIYVLESLICDERYSDALDLLKTLQTCGGICNSKTDKQKKCNCHG